MSAEKTSQREPLDVRYNYRRVESTALESAANVPKRDSPLDLSVKTIRQSADSTALDDPESSYGQHFPLAAHQSLRNEGRHAHLPQLPYASAVAISSVRNHSNSIQNRQFVMPNPPSVSYQEINSGLKNGQLRDELSKHPLSQYKNEKMTVSITYEQNQETQHTQVNTQLSSLKYSSHYYQQTERKLKNSRTPHLMSVDHGSKNVSHVHPTETNNISASVAQTSQMTTSVRKRRPIGNEISSPIKAPRVISQGWRENINKEIENRLNAYTSMKAKEEEEKLLNLASRNNDSYRSNALPQQNNQLRDDKESVRSAILKNEKEQLDQYRQTSALSSQTSAKPSSGYPLQQTHSSTTLPFPQYLEQQQQQQQQQKQQQQQLKAQHKLPVQPIQLHHSHQQWYQNNVLSHQRPLSTNSLLSSPCKPSVFHDSQALQFSQIDYNNRNDLKIIEKIENPKITNEGEKKPLPPFRALPLMSFSPQTSKSTPPPPPLDERLQETRGVEIKLEQNSSDSEFSSSHKEKEGQSKAALMASAKAHPRIRTKAELKQVSVVFNFNNYFFSLNNSNNIYFEMRISIKAMLYLSTAKNVGMSLIR